MGTFSDSTIQRSRLQFACAECQNEVRPGDQYLRYKAGLRNDVKICLPCATTLKSESGARLRYDCAVLQDLLIRQGIAA